MTRAARDFVFLHKSWLIRNAALSLAVCFAWGGGQPPKSHPLGLYPTPAACSDHPGSTDPLPHRRGRRAGRNTETRVLCVCPPPNNSSSHPAALAFVKPNVSPTTVWFSSPNKACCYFFPCAYAQNLSASPLCHPHTRLLPPETPSWDPPGVRTCPVLCPGFCHSQTRSLIHQGRVFFPFYPIISFFNPRSGKKN